VGMEVQAPARCSESFFRCLTAVIIPRTRNSCQRMCTWMMVLGIGGGAGRWARQADTANAEVRTVNAKLKSTLTQLRSSRNLCMDITLICVVLGIAAYIYSWFS
jgi:hypothetical protein